MINTATAGAGRRCLMNGASGYLGSRIKKKLEAEGWRVTELTRKPKDGADAIAHVLGEPIAPDEMSGFDAFISCAYDFNPVRWADIRRINVDGPALLLRAAKAAGVPRIMQISTISAYEGCKSFYGKGKLEVEATAREVGAWAIRPGLVYGDGDPGAAFGALVANVRRSTILPIPGNGLQYMYMIHEDDLTEAIARCLDPQRPVHPGPVTVAHPQPWSFREILKEIARALGRPLTVVPLPWRIMWLGLSALETLGVRIGLRSDSLVSLVNQNTNPDINVVAAIGVTPRPFAANLRRK